MAQRVDKTIPVDVSQMLPRKRQPLLFTWIVLEDIESPPGYCTELNRHSCVHWIKFRVNGFEFPIGNKVVRLAVHVFNDCFSHL